MAKKLIELVKKSKTNTVKVSEVEIRAAIETFRKLLQPIIASDSDLYSAEISVNRSGYLSLMEYKGDNLYNILDYSDNISEFIRDVNDRIEAGDGDGDTDDFEGGDDDNN